LRRAEPVGDPLLLWRASERLAIAPTATEAAETGDLLSIGERVTFHSCVRRYIERRRVKIAGPSTWRWRR